MNKLAHLQPNMLWQIFENICQIPHPSKHEQQLSAWIQAWAKRSNLSVKEDKVGNLIIKKPASAGMENKKGVILQAHMDMVPQKNAATEHDFLTDPIKPYIITESDGDWVTAEDTTLGADNGIGLSSALAVLASDDIAHGPLEVLITIDEEAGMTGAFGLEAGWLDGELLINTDSEQEGEICIGCAGGIDGQAEFDIEYEHVADNVSSFNLSIFGLKGGHSGVDIHTGRANANKLLVRFLVSTIKTFAIQITELNGGSLRNAIPREADVSFVIANQQVDAFKAHLADYLHATQQALKTVEPDIDMLLISPETFDRAWTASCQHTILHALNACPNGVLRMSDDVVGVVETSLNLGVMRSKGKKFSALTLIRSLNHSGSVAAQSMVDSVFTLADATVEFSGEYPGWQPDPKSALTQVLADSYQALFNDKPQMMVIHAGLECGLFKTAYPHWDMVSFGPTINFPHSPDEKVKIDTVTRYWQLLVAVLENIPTK